MNCAFHLRGPLIAATALVPLLVGGCKKEEGTRNQSSTGKETAQSAQTPKPAAEPGRNSGEASPHEGGVGAKIAVSATSADGSKRIGPLAVKVPSQWRERPPQGPPGMRVAEWLLGGNEGEAELVVYYFGTTGAGGVAENLKRWYGQFRKEDGSSAESSAKTDKRTVNGLPVTVVDISGRYVAAMRPGAAEKNDKPGYRMLAAIVETSVGPWYLKLVGPANTVGAVEKEFNSFVNSFSPAAPDAGAK
jgi:hypothetical protein